MPDSAVMAFMMRDFLCGSYRASGLKTKNRPGHQVGFHLRERSWFEARLSLAHPDPAEARPDPPWPLPARLAEPAFYRQLVPDAGVNVIMIPMPSRLFFTNPVIGARLQVGSASPSGPCEFASVE
jgi:hypothetical protein